MAILRGMPPLMKKTGHDCPKNCRSFIQNVLGLTWKRGCPAVDEVILDERIRAYNEGWLEELLKRVKKKH